MLRFFAGLAIAVAAVARFFPIVGVYLALVCIPCAVVGVISGAIGAVAPLRVPDWVHPVKNPKMFACMLMLNGVLLAGSGWLAMWCVPRVASTMPILGAALLAALTIFVGARYGMRNQGHTARNAWLVRNFPDIRGALVAYQPVRESGRWERLGLTVLATVLSSSLTWMLGFDSGIEIFNHSVGGLVFLNVSVRAFG